MRLRSWIKLFFILLFLWMLGFLLLNSYREIEFIHAETLACEQKNGFRHPAVTDGHCQIRECIRNKNCVPQYENTSICKTLSGDFTLGDITFLLGEPVKHDGKFVFFQGSGNEPSIRALFRNDGNLDQLDCVFGG